MSAPDAHDIVALPCGCSAHTRCAKALDLRDALHQARQGRDPAPRISAVNRYAFHVAPLFPGWPPGTRAWPIWNPADEKDPRHA